MKQQAIGQINERITAIGILAYPTYIVRGDARTAMIESGVNPLGPLYLSGLKEMFGETGAPDYLLLTHSHYDHVGSAGYLKSHLPGLRIGAHARVAPLMQKQSVLDTMNRLSAGHSELLRYNTADEDLTLRPFQVDLPLKQGDELDLGGLTCRVYEVPGHTRDSLAYYFPEIDALFPGDALGVLRVDVKNSLQVAFVASYDDYVRSVELLAGLHPSTICMAHNWVLTGRDAADFPGFSLSETLRYRELVEQHLDAADGDIEKAIETIAAQEYDAEGGQPNAAYLTNLAAQVKHLAELRSAGQ